ncbi:MAG: c-type cytochrome [Gemmatimonadaceae bacterium]
MRRAQMVRAALCAVAGATAIGCDAASKSPNAEISTVIGSANTSTKISTPSGWPDHYGLGQPAPTALIAALDTDVDTTGAGLPAGQGTPAQGAVVYQAKCAGCHGPKGEGIKPFPPLIQPIIAGDSFPWAKNPGAPKTVGNYWPFATTLYSYIRHSMPQASPGSLAPDEVYQVVAYILSENGVLARDATLNAQSLPLVKLPMRKRFIIDTRRGGAELR